MKFDKILNKIYKRNLHVISTNKIDDYIIIGGGSAGCVLANRLSENRNNQVTLLEAGPSDIASWDSWKIQMPAAFPYNLSNNKYNWSYHTVPQKHLDNRILSWPRGRVLGGSSSTNSMVYIRGNPLDYNRWEKEGADSWSYGDCLPYFKKAQKHELGGNIYRGDSGLLHVSRGNQHSQPLFQAFIDAAIQAGYPFTDDMNGYQQEGFGRMDMTIYKGCRWSASYAYLRSAEERSNLKVKTNAFVQRILFNDKKKAIGVEIKRTNGQIENIYAEKEIILSAGAINSPQLLMLSGIGNANDLKEHDIPLIHHLPGVGMNLQDHLVWCVQYESKKTNTLYKATWNYPYNMIKIVMEWFFDHKGMGSSAHIESGGFIRSKEGIEYPDIMLHFLPGMLNGKYNPGTCHAFQTRYSPMRPSSRGFLKLKSKNPKEHPFIDPNYLSTEQDKQDIKKGIKLNQEIFQQRIMDEFRGAQISPPQTDKELDLWLRNTAESACHPCCTNKMGQDEMSVVDPQTRVHGIEGLRIVDASIMPSMISGNLNASTIMMAEKASDLILGKKLLPKLDVAIYSAKDWQTRQR